jgi:hypothetical protein
MLVYKRGNDEFQIPPKNLTSDLLLLSPSSQPESEASCRSIIDEYKVAPEKDRHLHALCANPTVRARATGSSAPFYFLRDETSLPKSH